MKIGLIGYGKMGKEIFNLLAEHEYPVTVFVRSEEQAIANKNRIDRRLKRYLRQDMISEEQFRKRWEFLLFTNHLEELSSSDIVLETIRENRQDKLEIFHRLESVIAPEALLLTNTSSISIANLAKGLNYPERFCGFHFFYPIPFINIIEIIRWSKTSSEMLEVLTDFCKGLGKHPIIVYDAPGSVINATLTAYYLEGLYILEQGLALPSKIDTLGKRFFYIGPCESLDVIGIDLVIEVLERTKYTEIEKGLCIPDVLYKLSAAKRMGKKISQGIFLYQGMDAKDDALEFYTNPQQTHSYKNSDSSELFLAQRLLYAIFKGVLDWFAKGGGSKADLNLGIKEVLGMQEGPFSMMESIGVEKLEEEFDVLTQTVGERFRQANLRKYF